MMEAKPGPESEQQDDDDNRETKEGTKDGGMMAEWKWSAIIISVILEHLVNEVFLNQYVSSSIN